MAKKADGCTTTFEHCSNYETDVNLDSPFQDLPLREDDHHIANYYRSLQQSLQELNLPNTTDRTKTPRKQNPDTGVAIVVLSSPAECLAILLEGGRQCPGDMLLVMSPTWLTKDKSDRGEGLYSLYVKKAIVFDRGGFSYIDIFDKPRKCTYFVNNFALTCTNGQRGDGENIEVNLDCLISSSDAIRKRVDDTLLTRIMIAEIGMCYPETLAITYRAAYEYIIPNDARINVVRIENRDCIEKAIEKELMQFLKGLTSRLEEKIVVKQSGRAFPSSGFVSLHSIRDFDEILQVVMDLFRALGERNVVLIETYHSASSSNMIQADHSVSLRSTVCRKFDNTSVTTQIICGIGQQDQPIKTSNTIPQTIETTLTMLGLNDKEVDRLKHSVQKTSESLLNRIIEVERNLSVECRGGVGAQTDLIGVDFVLGDINGKIQPIGINVNSHGCIVDCQIFEFINPKRQGEAFKMFIQTAIRRSQISSMSCKTVLIIGAATISKRFIFDEYTDYGIRVILVDPDENAYASRKVSLFIKYDFRNYKENLKHATNIIHILKKKQLSIDGCMAFMDDCTPIAGIICDILKLHGTGQTASNIAKQKSSTYEALTKKFGTFSHFQSTHLYSSKCYKIKSEADIDQAIDDVGVPAVLKFEYGGGAVGVRLVNDSFDCKDTYRKITSTLCTDNDFPGYGLGYGNDMLLMGYIDGKNYEVDVVIFRRQLIAAFFYISLYTGKGGFSETVASMPPSLQLERKNQLITAAYQCCTKVGLVDGVFNVEMKLTTKGPKLLEINARLPGFYSREWILACYGEDVLLYTFMICLGIRPIIMQPVTRCQILGAMCFPSLHKTKLTENQKLLDSMIKNKVVLFKRITTSLEKFGKSDDEIPYCNIAVMDKSMEQAKRKLLDVFNELGLNTKEYDLEYLLNALMNES